MNDDWGPGAGGCSPERLAAFAEKLLPAIPGPLPNSEVATIIIGDDWVIAMVRICSSQRLTAGRHLLELDDLVHEALRVMAERCERRRAHGFAVAQAHHLSGFWRVAISRAVCDALRRLTGRQHAALPPELRARADEAVRERRREVHDAIRQLPSREQVILLLQFANDAITYEEIGSCLGLSAKTVQRSYRAALNRLRALLAD